MFDEAFIDDLASGTPTPGGGGACACAGVLAAALGLMVAHVTQRNKKYEPVHDRMNESAQRLAHLRENLTLLAKRDEEAFAPLAQAFKMPADTPDQIAAKDLALQSALVCACDVPLDMMHACAAVLDECKMLAREGSRMAISDVGTAAALARAAIDGAALNIYINADWMTDQALAVHYISQAHQITRDACTLADEIYTFVVETVSPGA